MVISLRRFLEYRKRFSEEGKPVVFTNGCFDIIHYGHYNYLSRAKKLGDILVVGVNTDSSVRRIKPAGRPLIRQKYRAALVDGLKPVDFVILFGEDTPEKLIRAIEPDILVKGADYKLNEIVGADIVRGYGGTVRRIKLIAGISTSSIIQNIKNSLE